MKISCACSIATQCDITNHKNENTKADRYKEAYLKPCLSYNYTIIAYASRNITDMSAMLRQLSTGGIHPC